MTEAGQRVLRSLVPVICPPEAVPLAEAIVDEVAATLAASGALVATAFDAGLLAYEVGAVARFGRPAHALSGERAERYYAYWASSQFGRAVKQLMSLACYEQPELMRAVGYAPAPWIAEVRTKRLTVYADDIARQEAELVAPDPLRTAHKRAR